MIETYLTEYRKDGRLFGSKVKARSWEEAENLASFLGEKVVGKLVLEVEATPESLCV